MTNAPQEPQNPPAYGSTAGYPQGPTGGPQYTPQSPYQAAPQPYGQQYPYGSPARSEAENYVLASILVSVIGFFFSLGVISGIVGVVLANKASELGANSQTAKIVAYTTLGLSAFGLFLVLITFGFGIWGAFNF